MQLQARDQPGTGACPSPRQRPEHRTQTRAVRGDPDGAIENCDKALGLKPDDAYALHARGLARAEEGDLDGMIRVYSGRSYRLDSHGERKVRFSLSHRLWLSGMGIIATATPTAHAKICFPAADVWPWCQFAQAG
jgi:hypothetical protein